MAFSSFLEALHIWLSACLDDMQRSRDRTPALCTGRMVRANALPELHAGLHHGSHTCAMLMARNICRAPRLRAP